MPFTDEERGAIHEALYAIFERVRHDEPVPDVVAEKALELFELIQVRGVVSKWHVDQIESVTRGLYWNRAMRKASPSTTTGLSIALSGLYLLVVPLDRVDPHLREPGNHDRMSRALEAIKGI
jgi:hypothetical protein